MDERFFLYVIDDGDWHRIDDVAEELGISKGRALSAAERLSEMKFIHYDREKGEVRMQEWLRSFPRAEWEKPGKRCTGTAIIEAGASVKIQEVKVYNELDSDLEVSFRVVDEKLEVLILTAKVPAEEKAEKEETS